MSLPSIFSYYSFLCILIMDPSLLCKIFFVVGTAIDLGGTLIPSFRKHIMNYGSRTTSKKASASSQNSSNLLEYIASFEVPHSWFTHYYIVSTSSSIYWGHQILTRGQAFNLLAAYSTVDVGRGMTANQVLLAWSMMSVQGTRRLYESLTLTKPSKSKMWAGLWAIGIVFYVAIGVSVWIEGISK